MRLAIGPSILSRLGSLGIVISLWGVNGCSSDATNDAPSDATEGSTGGGAGSNAGGPTASAGAFNAGAGSTGSSGQSGSKVGSAGSNIGSGGSGGESGRSGQGGSSGSGAGGQATGGNAGSTGSGGGGPHTVGKCDKLKGSGEWEYIWPTPPATGSQAGDATSMAVDPFDAATVWASAFKKGLFKSTDCGSTWTHVNSGTNGAHMDEGSLVSIALDPVVPGVIYISPIYGAGGVWKSTNGGVDWTQLMPPTEERGKIVEYNHFDSVSMDPTDHLHLVVGTHAQCAAPYGPACHAETKDGGATWRFVKIPGDGWQEQAGPFVIDAKRWLYAAPGGLWLTADNGATWTDVNPGAAFGGGEIENHGISRGKDGTYYLASYSGIARSTDAKTWTLIPSSGGRSVGFVIGGGNMYSSDQWSTSYHVASESDPSKWTVIAPPKDLPSSQGAPYLDYDPSHHVLYSSNFAGGLWRVVMP